jgi:hypothetical protein
MGKRVFAMGLPVLLGLSVVCGAARAMTLVETGGDTEVGILVGPTSAYSAIAVGFELDADYDDVTFEAELVCISCTGFLQIHANAIGPGASALDIIDGFDLTSSTPGVNDPGLQEFFSFGSLSAGSYYAIYSVTAGTGAWQSLQGNETVQTTGSNTFLGQFGAETLGANPYSSPFDLLPSDTDGLLYFRVSGTPAPPPPIPLPAGIWLMLSALLGAAGWTARKASA